MRATKQRGSSIVEFALGATLLVTVAGGVFQFGWSLLLYNSLLTSVTNAAVLGAQRSYDRGSPTAFKDDVKNMVIYADLTSRSARVAPSLEASHVSVTLTPTDFPQYLTVSITGYPLSTLFRRITLTNKPRVTVPFTGTVTCSTGC
ncbi:MAG TPA: TadE family protein [Bryobacteraceae bacterium]|nr:TadE family protein [Bryobacteraceae bacterium]